MELHILHLVWFKSFFHYLHGKLTSSNPEQEKIIQKLKTGSKIESRKTPEIQPSMEKVYFFHKVITYMQHKIYRFSNIIFIVLVCDLKFMKQHQVNWPLILRVYLLSWLFALAVNCDFALGFEIYLSEYFT